MPPPADDNQRSRDCTGRHEHATVAVAASAAATALSSTPPLARAGGTGRDILTRPWYVKLHGCELSRTVSQR